MKGAKAMGEDFDVEDALDLMDALSTPMGILRSARKELRKRSRTTHLLDAMAVEERSVRVRFDQETSRRLAELEGRAEDKDAFNEAVRRMVEDDQFHRLQRNLEWEAIRETLDERRELLAHAAAGLSTPGLTIHQRARIERVLRALDGADVAMLRTIHDSPSLALQLREKSPERYYALVSAGCVSESGAWGDGPRATAIGATLVAILEGYIPPLEVNHA
jgi:hypothetical protein